MADLHNFIGKFKLVSQENWEEYLKMIGVNSAVRMMASATKPTIECSVNGEEWSLLISNGMRDFPVKFKIGEEQEIHTPDGRNVKVIFDVEDGKVIGKQHFNDKEVVTVHEVVGDEWTATTNCGAVTCVRRFKREV